MRARVNLSQYYTREQQEAQIKMFEAMGWTFEGLKVLGDKAYAIFRR